MEAEGVSEMVILILVVIRVLVAEFIGIRRSGFSLDHAQRDRRTEMQVQQIMTQYIYNGIKYTTNPFGLELYVLSSKG